MRDSTAVVGRPDPGGQHVWQLPGVPVWHLPEGSVRSLASSGTPDSGMPREPWAAVATAPDGSTVASVSPSFIAGLFWGQGPDGLLFSDNVRALVQTLAPAVNLDADFIREFAQVPHDVPGTATAFEQVRRVVPGTTMLWPAPPGPGTAGRFQDGQAEPRTVVWCGAQSWPEPTLEGPGTTEGYLAAFDAAVDELVGPGPLFTQMSGGLDSTFVAASLVRHASPENPVRALCYSPVPEAHLSSHGKWDPDDYPIAKLMEDAYPGRIVVHRVHIPAGSHPLDAAASAAAATGVPTFNPGNQMWINHINALSARAGAHRLFSGTNGNAAFSYSHDYAASFYLRGGHPVTAWRAVTSSSSGIPKRALIRTRAVSPAVSSVLDRLPSRVEDGLRRAVGKPRQVPGDYRSLVGLGHMGPPPTRSRMGRDRYLRWLAAEGPLPAAGIFSAVPVPVVDPFTTASVRTFAAAMTPLEWSGGLGARGYARLLGQGRVPDAIRLRQRRGGQAWDEWFFIRDCRDRYHDEVAAVATTPILGGWVDHRALRTQLDSWPWGEVRGPDRMSVLAMNRILALAGFVREASSWCDTTDTA